MNLDACRVVLRPRSVSEVLDLALRVMSAIDARLYGWLMALVLLPCLGICLAGRYVLEWEWLHVWMLAIGLGTCMQGVFTVAVSRLLFTESLSVREVLGQFFRRLPSYTGALFLSRLILGLGALLSFFVFPLFWAWSRVAFVHEASLLEQASPLEAVKRASRFVATRFTSTLMLVFWFLLAPSALVVIFEMVGNDGLLDFLLQMGKPFGSLEDGGSPFALAGYFFAVPYLATGRFLAYIDQRTRTDGWDIQLKFMAIAAREKPAPRTEHPSEEAA